MEINHEMTSPHNAEEAFVINVINYIIQRILDEKLMENHQLGSQDRIEYEGSEFQLTTRNHLIAHARGKHLISNSRSTLQTFFEHPKL